MLAHGTTTCEAKTGYGLNMVDEIKQLEAIAALQAPALQAPTGAREQRDSSAGGPGPEQPVDLVPTFLGAHAVPAEYAGRDGEYVDLLVQEMLPAVRARWDELRRRFPADWPIFCDAFCEAGAFDLEQTRRILEAARPLGFGLKLHVDEFAALGGTPLAVELGAISADHLVSTPAEHLTLLASSPTLGVALPGTPFGLAQRDYTPGRALIDQGGALALATDLNPGTCWCESMQFVIALACRYMRLLPSEALVGATVNAAHAIGLGAKAGSLEPGKWADLVILDASDYRMLGYRFGTNLARGVIKRGRMVAGSDS
jgi:imidazolonepropionase